MHPLPFALLSVAAIAMAVLAVRLRAREERTTTACARCGRRVPNEQVIGVPYFHHDARELRVSPACAEHAPELFERARSLAGDFDEEVRDAVVAFARERGLASLARSLEVASLDEARGIHDAWLASLARGEARVPVRGTA